MHFFKIGFTLTNLIALHSNKALAFRRALVVCAVGGIMPLGHAASGEIKIGMTLPLSGPLAATGNDIAAGSRAAVESFNKSGGHKGQKIELIIEDDKFDAKTSEDMARTLVKDKGAVALMSCFGTVNCLSVAKVAQESKVPLLGPIAGAEILRDSKYSSIYSVRANASEEVGALLNYLNVLQKQTSPVVIQDDGFGKAYANSLQSVTEKYQYKPSTKILFDPKTVNYKQIAAQLLAQGKDTSAIVLIANTVHSVGIIKALNDAKYYGEILNLAGQANGAFTKGLGAGNQLAVFATVTPSPFGLSNPAAEQYRAAWQAANNNQNYSYIGFEAYLNMEIMIAAIKRATQFNAQGLDTALNQLNNTQVGGLKYTFAGKRRQAASYTDLAVLSQGVFKH